MFKKKSYIYDDAMGVCRVEDVVKLVSKTKEEVQYYVLRSVYQKDKVAYIPVENHSVTLRELISKEEALQKKQAMSEEFKEEQEKFETIDFMTRLQMADTLSLEQRQQLYERGEIEFVLKDMQQIK